MTIHFSLWLRLYMTLCIVEHNITRLTASGRSCCWLYLSVEGAEY